MKLSIVLFALSNASLDNTAEILYLLAPGAEALVVPAALSASDTSSDELTTSSVTVKPTKYDGVFEYLSNITSLVPT